MDRFVLPWGRLRTTPVPILSPPFPHLSRPQQAEVVVAVLQDKSRWLARRRVPFRLEGRPRAPDLGPEPPIPRARSVHDKMAFVLSPLSLSLLTPVFPISPSGVLGVRGLERNERRYVVSHLPPMADGGCRSQRRPSGPPPAGTASTSKAYSPRLCFCSQPAVSWESSEMFEAFSISFSIICGWRAITGRGRRAAFGDRGSTRATGAVAARQ